jgi:hypothetical protein
MMKKLSTIALMFIPALIFAQTKVEVNGEVKDKETGQTLSNCHVYINEHFGTLTDENGVFKLEIPVEFENDNLHISYLGFETLDKPVKDLNEKFMKVDLVPGAIWLDNVIVQADPWVDFRDIISEISSMYDNKQEFYAAVFNEIKNMEFPESKNEAKNAEESLTSGEENKGEMLPGIIAFCIASVGLVFMARPFLRLINKDHA